jgi:hypothetical protein
MEEMAAIHDKDEKLFAQEVIDGSDDYKSFAAETDPIVKQHIGAIHGVEQLVPIVEMPIARLDRHSGVLRAVAGINRGLSCCYL